ncbi:MAG: hypothetical protein M3487_09110 [Actinomycetota bacterium]|nr:hypothetical protein [Actinomycetota bacterium]
MTDDSPAGLRLPESLRDVVLGRVSAAGPDVQRLLEMAAVAGERFDPLLLAQVDDIDGRLSDALDQAVGAHLVEPDGASDEYRFVHALVRSTVGARLSSLRRARIHDRMAEKLEAMGGGAASLLAHHAAQAAMLGPALAVRAARLSRRAGDEAMAALEFRSAAEWYQDALDHWRPRADTGPDHALTRAEILTSLGTAQRDAGIAAFRETLLEASRLAADVGAVDLQLRATLANTRGTFANAKRVDVERTELLRATIAIVPDECTRERAQLLCLLAMELGVGPGFPERLALSSEAVDLARASGDEITLAWVLARREPAVTHVTTIDQRRAEVDELLTLAASQHDDLLRFWAHHRSLKIGYEFGERQRIEAHLAELEELAATLRQPEPGVFFARDRATYASLRGDFEAAERWSQDSVEIGSRLGVPDAWKIWTSQLYSIRFQQGRLGELLDGMGATNQSRWDPALWAGWSLLCAETGDTDTARESLEVQHNVDFLDYPTGHTASAGIAATGLAAGRVGDDKVALALLPLLDRAAGRCIADVSFWYGPVAHYQGILRGVLGQLDAAVAHLGAAIEMERQLGAQPWLSRSLAEMARMLRHRARPGDESAADVASTEATAVADAAGVEGIDALAKEPLATVSDADQPA